MKHVILPALSLFLTMYLIVYLYLASHKPGTVVEQHCDLAVSTTAGVLCFDRTDGHGRKVPFTGQEQEAVQESIKCLEKSAPKIIDPDPRRKL